MKKILLLLGASLCVCIGIGIGNQMSNRQRAADARIAALEQRVFSLEFEQGAQLVRASNVDASLNYVTNAYPWALTYLLYQTTNTGHRVELLETYRNLDRSFAWMFQPPAKTVIETVPASASTTTGIEQINQQLEDQRIDNLLSGPK